MLTLSFGFKKPQTGDRGPTFWPALEDNIQRLNDHNHNGANSSKLASSSINPAVIDLDPATWAAASPAGMERTLVTMPATYLFDDTVIIGRDNVSGDQVYARLERVTNATFYVYSTQGYHDFSLYFL